MDEASNSVQPIIVSELPEIMTADEVAEYLRVNRKTVYELSKHGEIPAARLGRVFRYHRDQILAFARGKIAPKAHKNGRLSVG